MNAPVETGAEAPKKKQRRFPWITAALASAMAVVAWKTDSEFVRNVAEVFPNSSWGEWAFRSLPSFFVSSPMAGEPIDGLVSTGQTALTLGAIECRDGPRRMLKEAVAIQVGACIATRLLEFSGMLPLDKMVEPDVGPSAVTVGFGTKYLVEKARDAGTRLEQIGWYLGTAALGVSATLGAWAAGDPTSAVAHATGFAGGLSAGYNQELGKTSFESTAT